MTIKWTSFVSHLAVLGVGVCLHLCVSTMSGTPDYKRTSPQARNTQRITEQRETGEAALTRLIHQQNAESERWSKRFLLPPAEAATQFRLDAERENKENHHELERLLALTKNFGHLTDFSSTITEALTMEDTDTLQAVFLCMYQRNPSQSFDELALRPDWGMWLDLAVWLHAENHHLIRQLTLGHRNNEFKDVLSEGLGYKLAVTDDVTSLSKAIPAVDRYTSDMLLHKFLGDWFPKDGETTAKHIFRSMSQTTRERLLDQMLRSQGFFDVLTLESGKLGEALLRYRSEMPAEIAYKIELRIKDDPYEPSSPMPTTLDAEHMNLSSKADSGKIAWHISTAINAALYHDRDYPELLIQGKISMEEIARQFTEKIEGEEAHIELFKHILYQYLAPHAPQQAQAWALENLDRTGAQRSALTVIANMNESPEPRTRRAIQVARHLFPITYDPNVDLTPGTTPITTWQNLWKSMTPADYSAFKLELPHNPVLEKGLRELKQQPLTP